MAFFLEYSVMLFGGFVLVLGVYTWTKINRNSRKTVTPEPDLKKKILEKATINSRMSSKTSSFKSKELSNGNTGNDFSNSNTLSKISSINTSDILTIEVDDDLSDFKTHVPTKSVTKNTMKNIRAAILEIANNNKTGILMTSFMAHTGMSKVGASSTIDYLIKSKYAVVVKSRKGEKYFLTTKGKKYCISEDFNMAPV